jgi:hypothetical protein
VILQRKRSRHLTILALFLLVQAAIVAFPQVASAEGCGTNQNLQAGYSTNFWTGGPEPLSYEGASAVILDRGGYVLCTTDTNGGTNFSTSWTMVFGNTGGWAQSGTMYRWGFGSCVKRWAEQRQTPTGAWGDYYVGGCSNVGESHRYWQQSLFTTSWVMRSNIDTTIIHQSGWSPFANWQAPFQVAYSAETYYAQSHIPGFSSAPQDWSSMQVQRFDNDTFVDTCSNVFLGKFNQNSGRWGNDAPHCDHIRSWTS